MKKICAVTAARAEYGLLKHTICEIERAPDLELCLVVTGMHLSHKYGYTVEEIREDGIPIAAQIEILSEENNAFGVADSMARAAGAFAEFFQKSKPDMLLVLGDRYELLPICQNAVVFGIPIAHISGGELTEGAVDDVVRHAVTKMSRLHFPGCETYRKRIIQMGEEPKCVFNYGDVGVENMKKTEYLSITELESSLGISLDKPYACVTFHPVTLEQGSEQEQVRELLAALDDAEDMQFVITKANADVGGALINDSIDEYTAVHTNCYAFCSVGSKRYLSLMKHCEMVIGNSSSGIVEAPCFGIPTVNIGDRQKGRLKAESIIDCKPCREDITAAVRRARSDAFKTTARHAENPYDGGETSVLIVREIERYFNSHCGIGKHFYDIDFKEK